MGTHLRGRSQTVAAGCETFFLISTAADMLKRYMKVLLSRLISERLIQEDVLVEHWSGSSKQDQNMWNGERKQGESERQG